MSNHRHPGAKWTSGPEGARPLEVFNFANSYSAFLNSAPFRRCFSLFAAYTEYKNILKLIVVSAVGNSSGENQRGRLTEKKTGQDGGPHVP